MLDKEELNFKTNTFVFKHRTVIVNSNGTAYISLPRAILAHIGNGSKKVSLTVQGDGFLVTPEEWLKGLQMKSDKLLNYTEYICVVKLSDKTEFAAKLTEVVDNELYFENKKGEQWMVRRDQVISLRPLPVEYDC